MEELMEFMRGLDWSPLLISLKTGVVATILSFFGGIFAARQVIKAGPKTKAVLDGILTLPMVLPPTVAGFFLLLIFSLRRPFGAALYEVYGIKVVQTWLGCVLAATVIAFPLMYRNARAAFEQVDANLIYAARTLGMSEMKIFWKVVIPSARPGILSGTILTFARAMGEYGATSMLAGNIPKKTGTISQKIAMVIQNGDYKTAGFWVMVIMVIAFVIVLLMNLLGSGKKQTEKTMVMIGAKDRYVAGNDKKETGKFLLDVDFCMDGGVFAILGASGCGKSMTLKCIAGIERPDEGRIVLNDRVLFDSKKDKFAAAKRKVGYMFQDYALFPNMNVVQNIQAGMGRKPDKKKVQEYITGFQLTGLETHMPNQLSGGQKQRVAMARMLAAEPQLLLLDEPFAALDSYLKWKMEQQMMDLLKDIKKPALFVSHSRDEVYRLCDTVSCINQGKMEVIEPVKEFFKNPKTKTAALLSGCKNICSVELVKDLEPTETPMKYKSLGKLWAAEWGVAFDVSKEALTARTVGIRPLSDAKKPKEGHITELTVGEYRILEDPFEWNISFRKDENCEWLQWKISKSDWNPSLGVPKVLYAREEDLLLLDRE